MRAALLDVNVLIALSWPAHEHHGAAHRWFSRGAARAWATCPLTQLAFVRIISNPAFSRDAVTIEQAVGLLARSIEHPGHAFWSDEVGAVEALRSHPSGLKGHGQVMDAYLVALARHRGGVLATLDRGLTGKALHDAVEIVPT